MTGSALYHYREDEQAIICDLGRVQLLERADTCGGMYKYQDHDLLPLDRLTKFPSIPSIRQAPYPKVYCYPRLLRHTRKKPRHIPLQFIREDEALFVSMLAIGKPAIAPAL